jgi:hypothetical protein
VRACDGATNADHGSRVQLALSVMVRNGDAHLKNFGLLYRSQ